MPDNALMLAANYLFRSTWFVVLVGLIVTVYLLAFLWKILRSEEGFMFGYGNWVIGKWQAVKDAVKSKPAEPEPLQDPEPSTARLMFEPQRKRELAFLQHELQVKVNVLRLSGLLDGDLAFLMMGESGDWETKVLRAFQTIVSGVTRVVRPAGHCRCGFFVLDDDEQHLVLAAGEGYPGPKYPRLALEHSCAGRAFVTGEKYYCRDIATDPVYWPSVRGNRDFRSIACTPVRAGKTVFGVLCLDAAEAGAFSTEDFAHLEIFATKLAVFCAYHARQGSVESDARL